jgi:hypothetical protein
MTSIVSVGDRVHTSDGYGRVIAIYPNTMIMVRLTGIGHYNDEAALPFRACEVSKCCERCGYEGHTESECDD